MTKYIFFSCSEKNPLKSMGNRKKNLNSFSVELLNFIPGKGIELKCIFNNTSINETSLKKTVATTSQNSLLNSVV